MLKSAYTGDKTTGKDTSIKTVVASRRQSECFDKGASEVLVAVHLLTLVIAVLSVSACIFYAFFLYCVIIYNNNFKKENQINMQRLFARMFIVLLIKTKRKQPNYSAVGVG